METIKVMILQQERGEKDLKTGGYPQGNTQTVSYYLHGLRKQRILHSGDIVEMDAPFAKKFIQMGLCRKADPKDKPTIGEFGEDPTICNFCHSLLKTDSEKKRGYCENEKGGSDCEEQEKKIHAEEEARRFHKPLMMEESFLPKKEPEKQ